DHPSADDHLYHFWRTFPGRFVIPDFPTDYRKLVFATIAKYDRLLTLALLQVRFPYHLTFWICPKPPIPVPPDSPVPVYSLPVLRGFLLRSWSCALFSSLPSAFNPDRTLNPSLH